LFAAFYLRDSAQEGPRVGFTTPRGLGRAVVRNRIRRRVREAVRLRLDQLNPQCALVINPRRKALDAPFAEIRREVEKLFLRCNAAP
jgi:ribonuclease P protein component